MRQTETGPVRGSKKLRYAKVFRLPPRELSPNARTHWGPRHRASKEWATEGWVVGREMAAALGLHEPMRRAKISYLFEFPTAHRRDLDNYIAMMKPFVDGLVRSGLIVDDSHEHIEYGASGSRVNRELPFGATTIYVHAIEL